jgi:hypothetical protein
MDFLEPLAALVPHLGLVGGYVEEYVAEYVETAKEKATIEMLRWRGENALAYQLNSSFTVFVTQYDPNTYKADLIRHSGSHMNYRIGRAMFETSSIPDGWKVQYP